MQACVQVAGGGTSDTDWTETCVCKRDDVIHAVDNDGGHHHHRQHRADDDDDVSAEDRFANRL